MEVADVPEPPDLEPAPEGIEYAMQHPAEVMKAVVRLDGDPEPTLPRSAREGRGKRCFPTVARA
jgi:hypothetical protein